MFYTITVIINSKAGEKMSTYQIHYTIPVYVS